MSGLFKRIVIALALAAGAAPVQAQLLADNSDPLRELSRMSLEELSKVEVTSVSKSAQSLSSAPASIFVITREEIDWAADRIAQVLA